MPSSSEISSLQEANNFSISWFARRTGMARETISRRIEGMRPDGNERGHPVYNFNKVMDALYAGVTHADENGIPNSPRERKDYYDAELKRLEFEKQIAQLVPVDVVHSAIANIHKKTALAFSTLADVLERDAGLTPEQIVVVDRVCDDVRSTLYNDMVDD